LSGRGVDAASQKPRFNNVIQGRARAPMVGNQFDKIMMEWEVSSHYEQNTTVEKATATAWHGDRSRSSGKLKSRRRNVRRFCTGILVESVKDRSVPNKVVTWVPVSWDEEDVGTRTRTPNRTLHPSLEQQQQQQQQQRGAFLFHTYLSSNICTAWYHPIPRLGAPHPTKMTSACPSLANIKDDDPP
jgi:hypothetical protein